MNRYSPGAVQDPVVADKALVAASPPAQPALAGPNREAWLLVALILYGLFLAIYFVVRFGGQWAETDTAAQALTIRSVLRHASLVPEPPDVYPNGSGYAAVSIALLGFTGLDVAPLQQLVHPLTAVLLVLPAWMLYREFTGSGTGAALAALLLFTNPEFLFVVFRGSHERVLRVLMLVALWLLVRSFRYRYRPARYAAHVLLFYVVTFGLISTNTFFGLSFALACATALAGALGIQCLGERMPVPTRTVARRLAVVTGVLGVFVFLYVFYLYSPAVADLRALGDLGDRLLDLSLGSERAADPYSQVAAGWTNLYVYFLLSSQDYVLLLVSASLWVLLGVRWLRAGAPPPPLALWLLWLFYGAFTFQGALAIVADRSGALGGNLQHRLFPSFAMVAAPLIVAGLSTLPRPRPFLVGVAVAAALFTAPTLLKATNEPAFSNKWMFYAPAELHALRWANAHHRQTSIWVGPDERLSTAFDVVVGPPAAGNRWDIYQPDPSTRAFVISELIMLQSARLGSPVPAVTGENRIYDNGSLQLYRLRSRTPYQP